MNSIKSFDYVIIETGYTARVMKCLDKLKTEFLDDCVFESPEDCDKCSDGEIKEFDKNGEKLIRSDDPPQCDCINDKIMFIEDHVWGTGLYEISKDVQKIKQLLPLIKNLSGTICFKCNTLMKAMQISKILMNMDYCACFCFENLYEMQMHTIDNYRVLIMTFDCESG